MARIMEVTTPLDPDLLFHGLSGSDEMSRLSEYSLSLLSLKRDLPLNELLAGDLEGAAATYSRLLAGKPEGDLGQRCAFRLGTVLYRLGRADEAEPLLAGVTKGKQTAPEFRAAVVLSVALALACVARRAVDQPRPERTRSTDHRPASG